MFEKIQLLTTELEVKEAIKKTSNSDLNVEKKRQILGQLFKRLYQVQNTL